VSGKVIRLAQVINVSIRDYEDNGLQVQLESLEKSFLNISQLSLRKFLHGISDHFEILSISLDRIITKFPRYEIFHAKFTFIARIILFMENISLSYFASNDSRTHMLYIYIYVYNIYIYIFLNHYINLKNIS